MKLIPSTDRAALQQLKARKVDFNAIVEEMRPLVQEVRARGDSALKKYAKKFDGCELSSILVSGQRRRAACEQLPEALQAAILAAKQNIERFHSRQMPQEWWIEILPGIQAGQLVRPLERVGCYIPGGRYPLISTVLMTVLPAQVAGVKEIAVCTPKANPEILAACELCGVQEVFEVGGAAAIAALAYGSESIRKVNKIVGPGNLYVSAAKKIVYGDVGIDFIAGPSELAIIADQEAQPSYIASDLLAQAEHDPAAMALCLTPSRQLGERVLAEVQQRLSRLPTQATARAALEARGAVIITDSLEEAFQISNFLAPEHLEIHVKEAASWLKAVENAGSIFVGEFAPEAAGDYATGTNHVLPTGGLAAAQSGLSVKDFIKTPTVQQLNAEGLRRIAPVVIALAEAEGLAGHAESIRARLPC